MKPYSSRKRWTLEPRKRILIVCEGEKTEPSYFEDFRTREANMDIVLVPGKRRDARGIIHIAKKKMKEKNVSLKNGDGIWCAFDVDASTNEELEKAGLEADKNGIRLALSNPLFELWILLHYEDVFSNTPGNEVVKRLKKHIPNYSKVVSKDSLDPNLPKAVKRAKALNKKHEKNGVPLISRDSNPSSQVFQLIDFIEKTKEANRRAASGDPV